MTTKNVHLDKTGKPLNVGDIVADQYTTSKIVGLRPAGHVALESGWTPHGRLLRLIESAPQTKRNA